MARRCIIQMAALYLTATFVIVLSPSASTQLALAFQNTKYCSTHIPNKMERLLLPRTFSFSPTIQIQTKPIPTLASYRSSRDATFTEIDSLSNLTLSELLDILHDRRIRYAPTATRHELEELIRRVNGTENSYINTTTSEKEEKASSSVVGLLESQEVMDAIVLSETDQQQQQRQQHRQRHHHRSRRNQERVHARTYQQRMDPSKDIRGTKTTDHVRNHSSRHNGSMHDKRNTARTAETYHHRDSSPQQYRNDARHDAQPRHPRHRHPSPNGLEYDIPIIDIDSFVFDIPEDDDRAANRGRHDVMYDNGWQIFVMGFVEAGKTAAELALDAARNVMDPWTKQRSDDGDYYWLDAQSKRNVYDANVVEYTRERYGENGYDGDARKRRMRNRSGPRSESDRGYRTTRQGEEDDPEFDDRGDASLAYNADQWKRPSPPIESGSTPVQKRHSPRSRNHTNEEGKPKHVYGLYSEGDTHIKDDEENSENRHTHHHKQQWKERLRRKFDAALGLESLTSTDEPSYYDSWRRHMNGMDDSRQTRLREKIKNETESTAAPLPSEISPPTVPRNRRARMRASKNRRVDEPSVPPPREKAKYLKLRLVEKPFWKERGSIASMLFDNRPSSSRKDLQNKRMNTLEQLLLSPLGRERTLTSLLLYITRSSLAVFGKLCRWAGVRGTIPQPIVVVTVSAVVLSSCRGQQRLLSLGLTLLAVRMMGEFIHGSVHGNEFWDDQYDEETHEWVVDDDADDVGRSYLQRVKR